jgi:Icc-related predicted phosphoesterase
MKNIDIEIYKSRLVEATDFETMSKEFQIDKMKLKEVFSENLDILITHGPPYGIFDRTAKKVNAGCKYLLDRVQKVKPKIHIFGHIH